MLQDRGWLERQLQQLADAVARVLRLRRERKLDEARAALGETYEDLFGLAPEVLDALDVPSAALLLGAAERVRAWAELLDVGADLAADAGDPAGAQRLRERAAAARQAAGRPPAER